MNKFTTERLSNRPLAPQDQQLYIELNTDPEIMRYSGGPLTLARAQRSFSLILKRMTATIATYICWVIATKNDNRAIGLTFLVWNRQLSNQATIGIKSVSHFNCKLRWLLVSLMLIVGPTWAEDDLSSINYKLLVADKIRSSDPQQFNRLLSELATNKDLLSPRQLHLLGYLTLYQLSFQGKLEQALVLGETIIKSDASRLLKFRVQLTMVSIFAVAQRWDEGFAALFDILENLQQIKDEQIYRHGLTVASMLYTGLGEYEQVLHYGNQLMQRTNKGRFHCFVSEYMLKAKFKLGQIDTASDEIAPAIASCEQIGETLIAALIRSDVATQIIAEGKYAKARDYLLQYLVQAEKTSYPVALAEYYSLLAKAYYFEQDLPAAELYAKKTLIQGEELVTALPTVEAYKLLYQIAEQRNDYQSALGYLEQHSKANIAYLDEIKTKNLAFQLAKHTAVAQKSQLELFKQQNKLLTSEKLLAISEAENNRLFIAVLILIVTLLVFWIYKSRVARQRLTVFNQYDELTGVFSRAHFTEVADSVLNYCDKTEQQLSCIVFDLDHFKAVNDNYGHGSGDWVLKKVVEQCRLAIRDNDVLARIGANQISIILPGCALELALELAELCRQSIADIDTAPSGAKFDISASFGVTSVNQSGLQLEKLIADADSAMSQSKKAGHNRVTKFRPA